MRCARKENVKMLTKKQKLFCHLYLATRNAREAAAVMGAKKPESAGLKMLADAAVKAEIERLCRGKRPQGEAAQGLRRIAFGSIADAIRLLQNWDDEMEIDKLDLFNVSEIKFSKSGGMEIKFFDRIKALERLAAIDSSAENEPSVAPFIDAVYKGAERLRGFEEQDDGI